MKVIKPFRLSVMTRPYEVQRQSYLGVSTFVFFDLTTREILPEVSMWQFAAEELGKDAALDAGVPKRNGEFLVTGQVFAPGGAPVETCPASVRIGDREKTLYAIGDRFWNSREEQSKPQPFTSMPLTWERAFGGEGYAANPSGKGAAPIQTAHGPLTHLPNLELPGKLVVRPEDRPEPAAFGPLDLTRAQRLAKAGTYDTAWLQNLFPGLAADIDWTFWNIALADQQGPHFRGDESFELRNLHPRSPSLRGALPGVMARTFVQLPDREGVEQLLELDTHLTTVWFFPHAEKGILVYQGATPTREDDGADVSLLLVAADLMGAPRDRAHFERILALRLDKENGVFHALRDEQLLPEALLGTFSTPDEVEKMKEFVTRDGVLEARGQEKMRRQVEEARALIASYGLNPDDHGPSQPEPFEVPAMEDVPALMARLEADAKQMRLDHEARVEAKLAEVEPKMASYGVDPSFLRAEMVDVPAGPPTFTAEGELERIKGLDAQSRAMGVVIDELTQWIEDESVHFRWQEAERAIREAYLLSAHFQGVAPRLVGADSERVRQEAVAAIQRGESFMHRDLTGADLSNLDLRGADLRGVWLESGNLAGSNLDGADLTEAVLARADLEGASLHNTNLTGANLGGARFAGVRSGGRIDLSRATLMRADLRGADLSGAILDGVMMSEAIFGDTRFDGARAKSLTFIRTELPGTSFAGARLEQVAFVECGVAGVDFTGSFLDAVSFVQCRMNGMRFAGATTTKFVVCLAESMESVDFRGTKLPRANFRATRLSHSDFTEANLDDADFSECDLAHAKLYRAVARRARFTKAKLHKADFTAVNLMGADLMKADLRGTKMIGANLYGSSFARARSDTETVLTDSNQTKVTIYPLWRPE